jgi:DNA-binding beta-propeller fold protein YncE
VICAFHRIMTDSNPIRLSIPLILITIALAFSSPGVCAQSMMLVPLFSITGADMEKPLNQPSDVFIDEEHNEIYVVDAGNRRVVVFEMDGFGKYQFQIPWESGGPTSLVVNARGEILVTIGGKVAICDFRGNLLEYVDFYGFPGAEEMKPTRLKIDRMSNYYVLDSAQRRVLIFDSDWELKFIIDRDSFPKIVRNLTHGKTKAEPMVKGLSIGDISVDDEGMIYLVDSLASHVFVFDSQGNYVRSIGEPGSAFNTLSLPTGVAVDSQDRVLVVDATGHALLGYSKESKRLFALGGLGKTQGWFYFPRCVSADRDGRIYVVEPFLSRVQVLRVENGGPLPTRAPSLPGPVRVPSPPSLGG